PRGNPDIQRLAPRLDLLSAARRALRLPLPAGSVARAARAREHHVAPGRLHHPRALALPASRFGRVHAAESLARAAMLLPRDRDAAGAAAHRLFEAEIERLMKIGPADGRAFLTPRLALADHVGEQIAEGGRGRAADAHGKIEAFEA